MDDGELISGLSHRSHDNLGYVASPLLEECNSSAKAYSARALFLQDEDGDEEAEVESGCSSEEDLLDDSAEGLGIFPHGAALLLG